MRNIGPRIKSLRTEKGLSLAKLSECSNLSKGLLSKLENSEGSNPSMNTLYRIAEALEITVADILQTEKAQILRIIPEKSPYWLKPLVKALGREPDPGILDAMYVLQNRKADTSEDPKHWEFIYRSLENSFRINEE